MLSQHRQKLILDYLRTHHSAQVHQLGGILEASLSTVRRDLNELELAGSVRRVHGGVIILEDAEESPLQTRSAAHAEAKARIGAAAAALVENGETIIITGGTTTEMMLPHLDSKENVTVVTNALSIACKLVTSPNISVIVLGGWLRHSESSLLGHLTVQALREIHAHKIFQGTFGIDATLGLTGAYVQEVDTDRQLIAAARQLVVLADCSKFNQTGPVRVAQVEAIDTVVTDTQATPAQVAALRERGVAVILA